MIVDKANQKPLLRASNVASTSVVA